ncbi:hypothetical protein OG496_29290 [Streptomyces sp. NBC_00988]|uniref:hypothetical protein n=1 Tax=Streptomyces sp. NBC_00988 TaxID=2903704 RepID=UPI00386BD289|nr:hypothetical protein OG496_29290 [Streptomyces sp. NBC_00988]
MSANDRELTRYFALEGARTLLRQYGDYGKPVPDDPEAWRRDLFPVIRGLWNAGEDGGRNLYEIATQLHLAADLFAHDPAGGHPSLTNFPRAQSAARTPEVYRAVAAYVERWKAPFDRETLFGTPLTARELALRFPRLNQFLLNYFGQDGLAVDDDMQDATLEEGLHLVISDTHPWCPWQLPGLIAECAEARAVFHTEEQLDAFFGGGGMGGGSAGERFTDFFPIVVDAFTEHLREAHSPMWERVRG